MTAKTVRRAVAMKYSVQDAKTLLRAVDYRLRITGTRITRTEIHALERLQGYLDTTIKAEELA